MKPRELFGLAIRVFGLVSLLYFFTSQTVTTTLIFGLPFSFGSVWIVAKFIAWIFFTLSLLRGAPWLVRFAYPEESKTPNSEVYVPSDRHASPVARAHE